MLNFYVFAFPLTAVTLYFLKRNGLVFFAGKKVKRTQLYYTKTKYQFYSIFRELIKYHKIGVHINIFSTNIIIRSHKYVFLVRFLCN